MSVAYLEFLPREIQRHLTYHLVYFTMGVSKRELIVDIVNMNYQMNLYAMFCETPWIYLEM